jgi:hypothetical protein
MGELSDFLSFIGLIFAVIWGVLLGLRAHELAEAAKSIHEAFGKVAAFLLALSITPVLVTTPFHCTPDLSMPINQRCSGGLPELSQSPGWLHGYFIPGVIDLARVGVSVAVAFGITWVIVWPFRRGQVARKRTRALKEIRNFCMLLSARPDVIDAPMEVLEEAVAIEKALSESKPDREYIKSLAENISVKVTGITNLSKAMDAVKAAITQR